MKLILRGDKSATEKEKERRGEARQGGRGKNKNCGPPPPHSPSSLFLVSGLVSTIACVPCFSRITDTVTLDASLQIVSSLSETT